MAQIQIISREELLLFACPLSPFAHESIYSAVLHWHKNTDSQPSGVDARLMSLQASSKPSAAEWDGWDIRPRGLSGYWVLFCRMQTTSFRLSHVYCVSQTNASLFGMYSLWRLCCFRELWLMHPHFCFELLCLRAYCSLVWCVFCLVNYSLFAFSLWVLPHYPHETRFLCVTEKNLAL